LNQSLEGCRNIGIPRRLAAGKCPGVSTKIWKMLCNCLRCRQDSLPNQKRAKRKSVLCPRTIQRLDRINVSFRKKFHFRGTNCCDRGFATGRGTCNRCQNRDRAGIWELNR
jgi:hypothetical protein